MRRAPIAERLTTAWVLNHLIRTYGYRTYLEIGCDRDETFKAVRGSLKFGVDPVRGGTHRMTSAAFFGRRPGPFDLILIDGDHRLAAVADDLAHAMAHVTARGRVVLHDVLPTEESEATPEPPEARPDGTRPAWCGEACRVAVAAGRLGATMELVREIPYGLAIVHPMRLDRLDLLAAAENVGWGDREELLSEATPWR